MKFLIYFCGIIVGHLVHANQFEVYNNCPFTVWPATQGNTGFAPLENGGFQLNSYTNHIFQVPDNWSGRIWGRTNCNSQGHCDTGDCGNKIQCKGAGGAPPATLAEFKLNGDYCLDWYDVSLVDGYNLPLRISPVDGTYTRRSADHYDCGDAGCIADLNVICPQELTVKNKQGYTIACKSACAAFGTDQYCCKGAYKLPKNCKSTAWPVNYPAIFKQACPDAYSYAYDDTTSTFTCIGPQRVSYLITYCP